MRTLARAAALLAGMFARLAGLAALLSAGFGIAWLITDSFKTTTTTVISTEMRTTTTTKIQTRVVSTTVARIPVARATNDRALVVVAPRRGERLESGFTVAGDADVASGALVVRLLDKDGLELAHESVLASCGDGCRGTFAVTLDYVLAADGAGTVVVEDASSVPGKKPRHRLRIPVLLVANQSISAPATPTSTSLETTTAATTATPTPTALTTPAP